MINRKYPLYNEVEDVYDFYDLFRRNSIKFGDNPAISYKSGSTIIKKSYEELFIDARRVANYFISQSIANRKIGIISGNSYEWFILFLGAIFSNNIAVPIDHNLNSDEIAVLLDTSDVDYVFVSKKSTSKVNHNKCITLEELFKICADIEPITDNDSNPKSMSMIFFTSGSTGQSKGVMLSQYNMCFDVSRIIRYCYPPENTVAIAVLPFYHTLGIITFIFNLMYGREVFISKSPKQFLGDLSLVHPCVTAWVPAIPEAIYKTVISKVNSPLKKMGYYSISIWSKLLLLLGIDNRKSIFKEIRAGMGGNLEFLVCGGAPIDSKILKTFRSWGIYIMTGYGITECSPVISVTRNLYWRDGSAGQVLQDISVKIADDGEILIKGDNVFLGYYNDSKSTKNAFTKDGWFKTGDLGYMDNDDFLYITGRKKNLIILPDGENVSPEELEFKLCSHFPAIKELLVFQENNKIIAEIYTVDAKDHNEITNGLTSFNRGLSSSKRIHEIRFRDKEFQKTGSGKIKRNYQREEQ